MKRKCVVLLTACMLLMGGCGSRKYEYGLSPQQPQEIVVWNYYTGTQAGVFEELVNEFNRTTGKEKGIVVINNGEGNIDTLMKELINSAKEEVGAAELPNIAQCYPDMAAKLEQSQILVNLDDYMTIADKEKYVDSYIEEGILGNEREWKLFPIAKSTEVMLLNRTEWERFAEATGAKTEQLSTWEGLTKVAESYYKWSDGKSFFGRDAFANYMLVGSKQLGHPILKTDGEQLQIELDRTTLKKLWDNYYIPYIKGYYAHIGSYRTDDIKLGKLVAVVASTPGSIYFPKEVSVDDGEPYAIDALVLPIPNFKETKAMQVQQGAGMAVLKSNEKEEYASLLFLQWLASVDRNLDFTIDAGYLPVTKEASKPEVIESYCEKNKKSEFMKEVSLTAIRQMKQADAYITPACVHSYEARNILEKSMLEQAMTDYKEIQAELDEGMEYEQVLPEYLSEGKFNAWYAELEKQMKELESN